MEFVISNSLYLEIIQNTTHEAHMQLTNMYNTHITQKYYFEKVRHTPSEKCQCVCNGTFNFSLHM